MLFNKQFNVILVLIQFPVLEIWVRQVHSTYVRTGSCMGPESIIMFGYRLGHTSLSLYRICEEKAFA